jgi:hypothetical protein
VEEREQAGQLQQRRASAPTPAEGQADAKPDVSRADTPVVGVLEQVVNNSLSSVTEQSVNAIKALGTLAEQGTSYLLLALS